MQLKPALISLQKQWPRSTNHRNNSTSFTVFATE